MNSDLSQSKNAQQLNNNISSRRRHSVIIISDIECFKINYYSKKRRFSAHDFRMESSRLRTFDLYTTIFPKLPKVPSNKDLLRSESETEIAETNNEKILEDYDDNKENHNKEKIEQVCDPYM